MDIAGTTSLSRVVRLHSIEQVYHCVHYRVFVIVYCSLAAFSGALETCQRLIAAGADLDAIDSSFGDGRTALHKAAAEGHVNIVNLLIESGADASVQDRSGRTYSELLPSLQIIAKNEEIGAINVQHINVTYAKPGGSTIAEDQKSVPQLRTCSWCGQPDIAFSQYKDGVLCQQCTKNRSRKVF